MIPVALCLSINITLFSLLTFYLHKAFKISALIQRSHEKKHESIVYFKIFIILGLSWLTGIIAAVVDAEILWYIFTVLNASQGTLLFLTSVVTWKNINQACVYLQCNSKTKETLHDADFDTYSSNMDTKTEHRHISSIVIEESNQMD